MCARGGQAVREEVLAELGSPVVRGTREEWRLEETGSRE